MSILCSKMLNDTHDHFKQKYKISQQNSKLQNCVERKDAGKWRFIPRKVEVYSEQSLTLLGVKSEYPKIH